VNVTVASLASVMVRVFQSTNTGGDAAFWHWTIIFTVPRLWVRVTLVWFVND